MIAALKKLGIEGIFLNILQAIYDRPTANLRVNGEHLKQFPISQEMACMPPFSTPIQYSFGVPSKSNKIRPGNKKDSNKERRSQIIPICR
jgi:hypothetical protein